MLQALIALPLAAALVAYVLPSKTWRPRLLPAVSAIHLTLVLVLVRNREEVTGGGWLALDPAGRLVLLLISVLFLVCSFYAVGYLAYRTERANRRFCAALLGLLGMMSLVAAAQHLGLLWVALEATTLLTAPLIYFNRTARSIEATWKYLLVCSVGIALALLGTFFLAYASLGIQASGAPGADGGADEVTAASLLFADLVRNAPLLAKTWARAGFVLILVGYGTKVGLAPMHTWKPDAYGEAPGVVGAVLAGGLSSCAFLALLRAHRILVAAGDGEFSGRLLIALGLLSMLFGAVFLVAQRDIKRMLAYSSVEHMGILALATGVGGLASFGALLHLVYHGLTKTALFLSIGNLHRAFGGKTLDDVRGGLKRLPLSGTVLFAGLLAITGSPPFAPFTSELTVARGLVAAHRPLLVASYLVLLFVAFVGMGSTCLAALAGAPPAESSTSRYRDRFLTFAPLALLMGTVLVLGFYLPPPLRSLVTEAAEFLGAPS